VIQRLRRDYEMQVQFVDRELGRFLDKLKQLGIYDRALIVVTSDHGVSWKNEAPGRPLSDASAEMIFPVPLFIKLPGQTEGHVSTEDAQLIDLVPTIAEVAGITVPWRVAGHDLFEPAGSARQKIMVDLNGKIFAYPSTFAETGPRHNDKIGFLSVKLKGTSTTRRKEYKSGAARRHNSGHL
jgi:arylsulfatase A-like enzyme